MHRKDISPPFVSAATDVSLQDFYEAASFDLRFILVDCVFLVFLTRPITLHLLPLALVLRSPPIFPLRLIFFPPQPSAHWEN